MGEPVTRMGRACLDGGRMLARLRRDRHWPPGLAPVRVVGWDNELHGSGVETVTVYYETANGSGGFHTYPETLDAYRRRLPAPWDPYAGLRGVR